MAYSLSRNNHPFTVIVEGNIGSGKTTFLTYLSQFSNTAVLQEPVDKWRNCNGFNLLEYMYNEPAKWSFSFQSYVQLTMLEHHTMKTNEPIKLMERSIYSARNCFVEQMMKDGNLDAASVSVFDEWFAWAKKNCDLQVDLIVYLRTSPEVAYARTKQRSRPEEQCVPFEYIKSIHEMHENWLFHKSDFNVPAPVVILDADLDQTDIHSEYNRCLATFPKETVRPLLI